MKHLVLALALALLAVPSVAAADAPEHIHNGAAANSTYDCGDGGKVIVNGSQNNVTISGSCTKVQINGSMNNVTIGGSMQWNGIILVGGTLTLNGNITINGALVTGLNVLLGQSVPASDIGNGTKTVRYDSCNVENAMTRFNGLAPLRNSSADNWSSY